MPSQVIGLVGPIASGKGTVIEVLKKKGYASYSTSDVLKEEVRKRGLEVSRFNCNMVSNELRGKEGANILAKWTAEVIDKDNPDYVVIDAIRNPAEIEFFKEKYNAYIIGITASQARRYEMFVARGMYLDEIKSFEEFKELDDREMKQVGSHKQQIALSLAKADIVIENEGTVEDLTQKVETTLASLAG